jgi:hypothetical protein
MTVEHRLDDIIVIVGFGVVHMFVQCDRQHGHAAHRPQERADDRGG